MTSPGGFPREKFVSAVERAQLRRQGIRFLNDTAEQARRDEQILRMCDRARAYSLQLHDPLFGEGARATRGTRQSVAAAGRAHVKGHARPESSESSGSREGGPELALVLPFPAKTDGGASANPSPPGDSAA